MVATPTSWASAKPLHTRSLPESGMSVPNTKIGSSGFIFGVFTSSFRVGKLQLYQIEVRFATSVDSPVCCSKFVRPQ